MQDSTIAEGAEKEDLKQYVRGLGGKGIDQNGNPVNRLIVGQTYPLGAALTQNPAAAVKGVNLMEEDSNNKTKEKISLNANINVNSSKLKSILNMDKNQFDQLISQLTKSVASAVKEGSEAKTVGESIRDTLVEHNESWNSKMKVEQEAKAKVTSPLVAWDDKDLYGVRYCKNDIAIRRKYGVLGFVVVKAARMNKDDMVPVGHDTAMMMGNGLDLLMQRLKGRGGVRPSRELHTG